jgi:L-rhamnose mutarotase
LNKEILDFLKECGSDEYTINRLVVSAFLFGIISEKQLIKGLKKFKVKDEKMAKWTNKLINYIIIKYIHKRAINISQ